MMELPNYSRQLVQQLQALRKESLFCDCTILVGDAAHPAHKVVLAATSLLFKSVLETSDSISIDTAVVTAQEFSSLLDMVYVGRLGPGKHDFTRVITAADNLQMFDVAVGCKNILDQLAKQSEDARGFKRHADLSSSEGGKAGCLNGSGPEIVSVGHGDITGSSPNRLVPQNDVDVKLLPHKRDDLIRILQDIQPWINVLRTWDTLSVQQQHMLLECFEGDPDVHVVFQRLFDQVTDECELTVQAVVKLLDQIRGLKCELGSVDVEVEEKEQTGPDLRVTGGAVPEEARSSGYYHEVASDLKDFLTGVENVSKLLIRTADRCRSEELKQVLLECSREQNHAQALRKLLSSLAEKGIEETSVLLLLKEAEDSSTNTADGRTDDRTGASLLRTFRSRLCALNLEAQIIRRSLEEGPSISSDQREVLQKDAEGNMEKLLRAALNGGSVHPLTVWRLLFWAATHSPELHLIIQDIRAKPDGQELMHMAARVDALFKHKKLILDTINKIPEPERAAGDSDSDNDVTVFLQSCRTADRGTESMQQVLERVLSRELQHVRPLCRLLSASHASFPQLSVLFEELGSVAAHDEETAESEKEEEQKGEVRTHRRRKGVVVSYSCQWCNKTFDFKCRLLKHKKQCALCPERVQRCSECSGTFPSVTALQQHRAEVHKGPPLKRKKVEPVTCELCGKTFKHPSGLLYHRRTEHFEERPYECEECGTKFAANSSLKNHMRLHTGEKPYHCKHCNMSFAVAAALSYHTKKKHAEGKMYSCQYCSATFAQSIELTRHVRTHTGDKPYVCRECGKGFKQANGLSVHLQTFHNISDPHDCQKCRVSFGSLEKLREHILEVHPKELHQCPECSKILNTAAQLEKHMSVHDGSKPYSCQSCQKSYQTLSGLWYHNRTTHPQAMATEGSRSNSHLLHCKICDKNFCNRSSLFKHNVTKHPEGAASEEGEKKTQAETLVWKCAYCPGALSSEQELQQHVSSEHASQERSVIACAVEFQQHFLTNHVQLVQDGELQGRGSTSQMVIQTEEGSAEGAAQIVRLDPSHLAGSQQVFVALGDSREAASDTGIVAVNMEDLLTGRVRLICEENQ